MAEIEVVRAAALMPGDATPGITRGSAFARPGATVSRSRIAGAAVSAWHHHGDRLLFGSVVRGRLRLEYGPGGRLFVELDPGDFFHVPRGLVHRDVNPTRDREAEVVAFLVGEGVTIVNVPGPDE